MQNSTKSFWPIKLRFHWRSDDVTNIFSIYSINTHLLNLIQRYFIRAITKVVECHFLTKNEGSKLKWIAALSENVYHARYLERPYAASLPAQGKKLTEHLRQIFSNLLYCTLAFLKGALHYFYMVFQIVIWGLQRWYVTLMGWKWSKVTLPPLNATFRASECSASFFCLW